MLDKLVRRQPGTLLTVFVDVLPSADINGGLNCLFQRTDGKMEFVHERDLHFYKNLHVLLHQTEKPEQHYLLSHINPECRIELLREWGALEKATAGLKHKRETDPYAGLRVHEVSRMLFERLRSGASAASLKNKGPGP